MIKGLTLGTWSLGPCPWWWGSTPWCTGSFCWAVRSLQRRRRRHHPSTTTPSMRIRWRSGPWRRHRWRPGHRPTPSVVTCRCRRLRCSSCSRCSRSMGTWPPSPPRAGYYTVINDGVIIIVHILIVVNVNGCMWFWSSVDRTIRTVYGKRVNHIISLM